MSPRELIDQMLQTIEPRHARRTRSRPLDRLPAAVPRSRIISTASIGRTANSASSRIGRTCRSAARTRAGRSTAMPTLPDHWTSIEEADAAASVPARDLAGARLSQLDLQRNADVARAGKAPDRDDPSRRRAGARHRRWRRRRARQHARPGAPACAPVRRRAARRADRRVDLAELGLSPTAAASTR